MPELYRYKKYIIPTITIILLILAILLIDTYWWYPQEGLMFSSLFLLIGGFFMIEIVGLIVVKNVLKGSEIRLKDHFILKSLEERKFISLILLFSFTMIFEELLFRLYIFVFLIIVIGFIPAFLLTTLLFALYHIHTWFEFKDKPITYSFILISIVLGFILNLTMYYFGLLTCIILHAMSVLILFIQIEKKIKNTIN